MAILGTGILALTNKNLYFSSSTKNLKTPFKKLISLAEYLMALDFKKMEQVLSPKFSKILMDGLHIILYLT